MRVGGIRQEIQIQHAAEQEKAECDNKLGAELPLKTEVSDQTARDNSGDGAGVESVFVELREKVRKLGQVPAINESARVSQISRARQRDAVGDDGSSGS